MLGIVILVLLGCWTAGIAQKKGRSAGWWFLGGMIFGLLAVLLVYVLPPVKSKGGSG